jgi:predicted PurR-regulated permease PerM
LKLLDTKTAQALFTALIFALALLFVYASWRVLLTFLFALFFAYLLEAPVWRLQRWLRGSRGSAIALVYLILVAIFVSLLVLAAPKVAAEAQALMSQAPQYVEKLKQGQFGRQIASQHGWVETYDRLQSVVVSHRDEIISTIQDLVLSAARTLQSLWWLFLVPILAIFFLQDGRELGQKFIDSIEDPRNRKIVTAALQQMNSMLGDFLRAQVLLSALAVVVITSVLSLMRVPYALALGPAAGVLEFIPVVGPVIGGVLVITVAFLAGYHHLLIVFIFLLVWRGIQDYVSSPKILGDRLKLHPLLVMFGVLAGGEVAGVIGIFLSIPVLATLRILWDTWSLDRKDSETSTFSHV